MTLPASGPISTQQLKALTGQSSLLWVKANTKDHISNYNALHGRNYYQNNTAGNCNNGNCVNPYGPNGNCPNNCNCGNVNCANCLISGPWNCGNCVNCNNVNCANCDAQNWLQADCNCACAYNCTTNAASYNCNTTSVSVDCDCACADCANCGNCG